MTILTWTKQQSGDTGSDQSSSDMAMNVSGKLVLVQRYYHVDTSLGHVMTGVSTLHQLCWTAAVSRSDSPHTLTTTSPHSSSSSQWPEQD